MMVFLHAALFVVLSSFRPISVMSLLHASFHLRFGRPLLLFPGISTSSILLTICASLSEFHSPHMAVPLQSFFSNFLGSLHHSCCPSNGQTSVTYINMLAKVDLKQGDIVVLGAPRVTGKKAFLLTLTVDQDTCAMQHCYCGDILVHWCHVLSRMEAGQFIPLELATQP